MDINQFWEMVRVCHTYDTTAQTVVECVMDFEK